MDRTRRETAPPDLTALRTVAQADMTLRMGRDTAGDDDWSTPMAAYAALDTLIERLSAASWRERDSIKAELKAAAAALPGRLNVLEHLSQAKREIDDLEIRWEVEEVIEALTPAPIPDPEPEPEETPEDGQLSAADLQVVYDDPRGLVLHKTKSGDRWFATQRDPRSGQPQTFELQAAEVDQLKTQLTGSPYWVIGAGV